MPLALSLLCGAGALALLADHFYLGGSVYAHLPQFMASAAALTGLLIAALEYAGRKGKKKRRWPLALLLFNSFIGIAATAVWIWEMLAL